jgi:hypothetical protein
MPQPMYRVTSGIYVDRALCMDVLLRSRESGVQLWLAVAFPGTEARR